MKNKIMLILMMTSTAAFAFERGGDDSGNGGFAYKQSIKILEMAAKDLEHKIIESDLKDFTEKPLRRLILAQTLSYDNLQQLPKKDAYRGTKKLAMDYVVNPPVVKILKPYYETFMGKTDGELDAAALEVEKRLLHEASHIWGYNEKDAEDFALRFLADTEPKPIEKRPTNDINIKSDFCSCINGKSDIINDCANFCAIHPVSSSPILFLNTVMGAETSANPELGNLYNWCTVQLNGDATAPQCFLEATDGSTVIKNIPVSVESGSNSLTANIAMLSLDKTYIVKIVEGKTGSNAQSKEFQVRRKKQQDDGQNDGGELGALKAVPINQYTCVLYGGISTSNGSIVRTTFVRSFYYFASNEAPMPVPPAGGTNQSLVVCHDEQMHPGDDSAMYPRLETIPHLFNVWDKADARFVSDGDKMKINKILEKRLLNEYNIMKNLSLFSLVSYPNRPASTSTANIPVGYIMVPFTRNDGVTICPTEADYKGNDPLFNILGDYLGNTQGLYLAEKEAETIQDGTSYKIFYGTMFVTKNILEKYGFYVQDGVKILATPSDLHTKTIYYYWPTSDSTDPLIKGDRKLFTVKSPDTLNGNVPTGINMGLQTSDKSIGCVPLN